MHNTPFKIPPKFFVLFKGDSSDFEGNQELAIDIETERSLEGCKAHFRFLDFAQDFDEIPEDKRLLLTFSSEQTRKFPLGAMDATLTFEDAQGRTRTVANRIHIVVTNSVGEAYWNEDPQAITVVMSGDEYLKNAEVSEDGKTLTLTKKDGTEVQFSSGGGGGTDDYNDLENKPSINQVELYGDMSSADLGLQDALTDAQLANIADVPKKADEFTKWVCSPAEYFGFPIRIVNDGNLWYWTNDAGSEGEGTVNSDATEFTSVWHPVITATRKRVLRTGDADKLTDAQKDVLDGGPYLGKIGQQKIESDDFGSGASLEIENGSSSGGKLNLRGGPYFGGEITVEDGGEYPASIKKGDKEVATEEQVETAKTELNARIDLIEATSHPNMNIVGSPTFREGVVSGFSANDYLMFPTQVDVGQNAVDFYMSFTTGANVTTQQNILDSWCGLALAIQNSNLILAVSSNGTSFETSTSLKQLSASSSYHLRLSFDYNLSNPSMYTVRAYIDDDLSQWCEVVMIAPLHPTATYWGGANPQSGVNHIFSGTINLNECRMVWNGTTVWRGYDELPTVKFDPTAEEPLDTAEKIVAQTKPLAQYPISAVSGNALKDRTVNTSTGGAFTFPTSGTGARDFVVVVAASSTAPSVSFPSTGFTYLSDDDSVWTAEADKVNIWYFTEITTNQFMVAHKALKETTQA